MYKQDTALCKKWAEVEEPSDDLNNWTQSIANML